MQDLLRVLSAKHDHLKQRHDFAHGEQLGPDYAYFVGPKPDGTDFERVKDFESVVGTDDVIGPCLQRITDAIVGRDPEWSLTHDGLTSSTEPDEGEPLTNEQQAIIARLADLEAAGGDWHADVKLQSKLAAAHYISQWAGEAYVRIYLPEELARLDPDFEPPDEVTLSDEELEEANPSLRKGSLGNVAAALERVHLEVYHPGQAGEVKSQGGLVRGYYFLYKRNDKEFVEYHTPQHIIHYKKRGVKLEEVMRYDSPFAEENKGRFRRRKFMILKLERESGPALTNDLMQKQSRLNATLTNGNRNDHLFGYRSVITTNADPVTKLDEHGREVEVEWKLAPDIVTEIVGLPKALDSEGNVTSYESPGVIVIDPVNPEYNIKWSTNWEERVYATLDQRHIFRAAQVGLAVAAKVEMRQPFDKRVVKESARVALLLAKLIERALSFAQWLSVGEVLHIRCAPKMLVDVPRGNLELFRVLTDAYRDGLATIETVVEANPAVSDVDGETKKVKQMQEDKKEQEREQLEAFRLTTSTP